MTESCVSPPINKPLARRWAPLPPHPPCTILTYISAPPPIYSPTVFELFPPILAPWIGSLIFSPRFVLNKGATICSPAKHAHFVTAAERTNITLAWSNGRNRRGRVSMRPPPPLASPFPLSNPYPLRLPSPERCKAEGPGRVVVTQPHTHWQFFSYGSLHAYSSFPSVQSKSQHSNRCQFSFSVLFSFAVTYTRVHDTSPDHCGVSLCRHKSTTGAPVCVCCVCLFHTLFSFVYLSSALPCLPASIPHPPAGHARALLTREFICAGVETERLKPLLCLFLLGCWIVRVFLFVSLHLSLSVSPPTSLHCYAIAYFFFLSLY